MDPATREQVADARSLLHDADEVTCDDASRILVALGFDEAYDGTRYRYESRAFPAAGMFYMRPTYEFSSLSRHQRTVLLRIIDTYCRLREMEDDR